MITKEFLIESKLCGASAADKWVSAINETLEKYNISTPEQIAGFLAQCSHESAHFTMVKENLNYSWEALRRVFPKYFPLDEVAMQYNRNPEKIANRVYADRMGNGPESSGDGFKYCGRGLIQLTGKNNYQAFSTYIDIPEIMDDPSMVEGPELAVLSAGWFWHTNKLNDKAGDIKALTKAINGGFIGLDDRTKLYAQALAVQVA
jgi:putative chitinase